MAKEAGAQEQHRRRFALFRGLFRKDCYRYSAMPVHALYDGAKQFYLSRGFVQSPLEPMTLMTTMATVRTFLLSRMPHYAAARIGELTKVPASRKEDA